MNRQAVGALLLGILAGMALGEVASRVTRAAAERDAPADTSTPGPVSPPRYTPVPLPGVTAVPAARPALAAGPAGPGETLTRAAVAAVVAVARIGREVARGATFAAGIALGLALRACGGPLAELDAWLFTRWAPPPVAGPGRVLTGRTLARVRCTPTRGPDAVSACRPFLRAARVVPV